MQAWVWTRRTCPLESLFMRIHTLDLEFRQAPGIIATYLLECGGELALVETGPGSTLPVLLAGIRRLGFEPEQVRHVLVTHIHLDHAGAAGWWAQQGAQIYCHPNAAKHLIDPSRLMESARMVYGDLMDSLWGEMLPAPPERVTVLKDGECAVVGDTRIEAWDTPGHARHHHAFVADGVCFTGDVAGLRLGQDPYISVTAAPPQFEPAPYVQSIDRLLAGDFRALFLTHFGEVTDVADHLTKYRQRIQDVHAKVQAWVTEGCDAEEIRRRYAASEEGVANVSPGLWARYQLGNPTSMCADGIRLSVEKAAGR